MKRLTCTLLVLVLCALVLCPAIAEENENILEKYGKLIEGDWKQIWRYLPLDNSSFLSDKCKPANYWSYPDIRNRSGQTVETHIVADESGQVYLVHITSGDTHKIMSFDGGWAAKIYLSEDAQMLLAIGVDGTTCLYTRDSAPPQEKKK